MISDLIPHVKPGQAIKASDWNRMADLLGSFLTNANVYIDSTGAYQRTLNNKSKSGVEVAVADAQISSDDEGTFTYWTIGDSGLEATTDTVDATDLYGSGAVTGEMAEILTHQRTGKKVFKLSTWIRRVKPTVNITAGSSGNASVWVNGADTLDDITIHLDWMEGVTQISSGKEVEVHYLPRRKKWGPNAAECE